jgi:GINS complex subunit 3
MTIPNLGYLDGNADGDVRDQFPRNAFSTNRLICCNQIKQGTKLELPLWLAEMLAVSQSQSGASTVNLEFPKALSSRVQNALKADPKSVDLRQQAQHFYALGCRMLELFDEEAMADILDDVCFTLLS